MNFRNTSSRGKGTCAVLDCDKPSEFPDGSGEAVCWRHREAQNVSSHGNPVASPRKHRDGDRKAKRSKPFVTKSGSASRTWSGSADKDHAISPSKSDSSPVSVRKLPFEIPPVTNRASFDADNAPPNPPAVAAQVPSATYKLTPNPPAVVTPTSAVTDERPSQFSAVAAQTPAARDKLPPKPAVVVSQTSAAARDLPDAQTVAARSGHLNHERQLQAGNELAREILGEAFMLSPATQYLLPRSWQMSRLDWELVRKSYDRDPRTRTDINLLSKMVDHEKRQYQNGSIGASTQPQADGRSMPSLTRQESPASRWNSAPHSHPHSSSKAEIPSPRSSGIGSLHPPPPGLRLRSNGTSDSRGEYLDEGWGRGIYHRGVSTNGAKQPNKFTETIDLTLSDDSRSSSPTRKSTLSRSWQPQRQRTRAEEHFTFRPTAKPGDAPGETMRSTGTNGNYPHIDLKNQRRSEYGNGAFPDASGRRPSQQQSSAPAASSWDDPKDRLASQKRKAHEMVQNHLGLSESMRSPISPPSNANASSGPVSNASRLPNGPSVLLGPTQPSRSSAKPRDDGLPDALLRQPPTPPSAPRELSEPLATAMNVRSSQSHGDAIAQKTSAAREKVMLSGSSLADTIRMQRISQFDASNFDSQIYAQRDSLAPPPGVALTRRKTSSDHDHVYLHTNPAIHGMHQRSDEWYRLKSEEIAKRPRRKFWFGKVKERQRWLREQERQASQQRLIDEVAGAKSFRKDPQPWSLHQPMDFGDVPESELPEDVKSNADWLKICGRLREHRATKHQMVQAYIAQNPQPRGKDSRSDAGEGSHKQKTTPGGMGHEKSRNIAGKRQPSSREEAKALAYEKAQEETDRFQAESIASYYRKDTSQGSMRET